MEKGKDLEILCTKDYKYSRDGGIYGYTGKSHNLRIPSKIRDTTITSIIGGFPEFVETIQFPQTLNVIAGYSFYSLEGIWHLKFNDRITSIGEYAFANSGIRTVDFGKADVMIDSYAFYSSKKLYDVIARYANYVGIHSFSQCDSLKLIRFYGDCWIDDYAFSDCKNLSYVYLNNCAHLGSNAFHNCPNLRKCFISKNTVIEQDAFDSDSNVSIFYV